MHAPQKSLRINTDRYQLRKERLTRLLKLSPPECIVVDECWLVIKSCMGRRPTARWFYLLTRWWVLDRWFWFKATAHDHRLCASRWCQFCADERIEDAGWRSDVDDATRAARSDVDLRDLGTFVREVEPGLDTTIERRLK